MGIVTFYKILFVKDAKKERVKRTLSINFLSFLVIFVLLNTLLVAHFFKYLLFLGGLCFALMLFSYRSPQKEKLSDYGFFEGALAQQKPSSGVMPYSLNTPLFSDYAEKLRFIQYPKNQEIAYQDTSVLAFPVGTTLIKTFYFPLDFRFPEKGRKLIETRLLIHESTGWKALEYSWNEAQTDAFLEIAGDEKEINFIDIAGKSQKQSYQLPNLNQCKGCHNQNEAMTPIGPSIRQLNGDFSYAEGTENQLIHWEKAGIERE